MTNLSKYRLEPYEVNPFLIEMKANPEKYAYLQSVYKSLENLQPGSCIVIDNIVKAENLPLFIKIVCLFHYEIGKGIQFNSDFTQVIKKPQIEAYGLKFY